VECWTHKRFTQPRTPPSTSSQPESNVLVVGLIHRRRPRWCTELHGLQTSVVCFYLDSVGFDSQTYVVLTDGHGIRFHYTNHCGLNQTFTRWNKWVLNVTPAPLFFLLMQLAIAVALRLFTLSNVLNLLPERLALDLKGCKGLIPMVGLSVLSLRSVLCRYFGDVIFANLCPA
jgi:hypothetical protein